MELLKLVIVDDEPILLEGLVKTYDWKAMGFEVVGSARNGEQAIEVIRKKRPQVVLTDIRMKKISGLMLMEKIEEEGIECLFIILSAYRDFEYAQQACRLGAFSYLLKPIEDEKLIETMREAHKVCMKYKQAEQKYENWEKLLLRDSDSFLQVIIQKYVRNRIPLEKVEQVFGTLDNVIENDDRFITVYADVDLVYKITESLNYEAARFSMIWLLEKNIAENFSYWKLENEEGIYAFIIKTRKKEAVTELKKILETLKEQKHQVVAAISKPYGGIRGIKKSYDEAKKLFHIASGSGASAFTITEDMEEKNTFTDSVDTELGIVNAVRRNNLIELKEAFIQFIYGLSPQEELQCQYMHKIMLKTEWTIRNSYGMTEELSSQFKNYYFNLQSLNATKAVDVCYKILCRAIETRKESLENNETKYFNEYMSVAIAYINEHLNEEDLSIVSVASHVYLNPVYFGRAFKNTFHMTFKKYLLKLRMEKAKELLIEKKMSIGDICAFVGISNPSYFSHLFKEYTGKLPSEYRKEQEEI